MFEVAYLQGSRAEQVLFSNLTFKLEPGQWLWVKGKNGQGKTTLLKTLAGLIPSDKGYIYWQGQEIKRFDPHYLKSLLYLGHTPALNPLLSVKENLAWFSLLGKNDVQAQEIALKELNINAYCNTPCEELSFGQQQKVSLVRLAMGSHSPLWILDEPGTGLDEQAKLWLQQKINHHLQQGHIAIIASHEPMSHLEAHTQSIQLGSNQ